MKYANSVLDLIGNTPLVKLNKVTEGIQATVLVKLEYMNPGGSAKDRIAVKMLDEAAKEGKINPAERWQLLLADCILQRPASADPFVPENG